MGMRRRWVALWAGVAVAVIAGTVTGLVIATRHSVASSQHSVASSQPWWYVPGVSSCGIAAVYRVDHGSLQRLGDCAGDLLLPPPSVTLHVGQEVDVHMAEEGSGYNGSTLVPVFPAPTSSRPDILSQTSLTGGGSTVSFEALSPGKAELETQAFCFRPYSSPTASQLETCPVLAVTVVP
jgi:hypothetical protein